jgi:Domain of unknown function (DUF4845)
MKVESRDPQCGRGRRGPERGPERRFQRGVTLFGLLMWAILIGMVALVTMRVVPTAIEYFTIVKAINKVSGEPGSTVPQIRTAFDRQREIDAITSISGKDLSITKENEQVVIGFAYDSEIELFKPVYLLIKYEGRSKAGKTY